MTVRTQEEIISRITALEPNDWLGFDTLDLKLALTQENVRPYLKPDADTTNWGKDRKPPADEIRGYLTFAWDKANNGRGISSSRSISHLQAWMWLDGWPPETVDPFSDYEYYGKAELITISELYDFDWRAHDDGHWANDDVSSGISADHRDALIKDAVAHAKALSAERES